MVENRTETIFCIVVFKRVFHGLGNGDTQRAAAIGIFRQNGASRFRKGTGRRDCFSAEKLHHRLAVRLLVEGALDHIDLAMKPENLARLGQRRPPLTRAGFRGDKLRAAFFAFKSLRQRAVRLVRPRKGLRLRIYSIFLRACRAPFPACGRDKAETDAIG